jgi:hypothetical protein|tara:strand:+ start:2257 stop:2373 length:117 start_codon:yes stop_codon:yes gene_type:complete
LNNFEIVTLAELRELSPISAYQFFSGPTASGIDKGNTD